MFFFRNWTLVQNMTHLALDLPSQTFIEIDYAQFLYALFRISVRLRLEHTNSRQLWSRHPADTHDPTQSFKLIQVIEQVYQTAAFSVIIIIIISL